MEFKIVHELPGRIRLRTPAGTFSKDEVPALCAVLEALRGVERAQASHRTGSVLIYFERERRDEILTAVSIMTRDYYEDITMPRRGAPLASTLLRTAAGMAFRMFFLPHHVRHALCLWRAAPYIARGLKAFFLARRLNVAVLDAAAISSAILRRDFTTAGVIMTLMSLSEEMEAWTQHRSKEDLAQSLALRVDRVWIKKDGAEVEIPFSELRAGDLLIVRAGSIIPADGTVAEGEAVVNQSSMTGEPLGIVRRAGASVYAGTAVEEGEITIEVTAAAGTTRIDKIIRVIEESEGRKASVQSQAEKLADSIVPYNFALAAAVYLFTRS
ncbi:MAG TPA: heavy metal translocating P-type ATPase, partial [Candidatus Caccocola faecipullorum]|nr:heavy metal translocating P-type ATPase [Candidatus Caccocola faecipullorum]